MRKIKHICNVAFAAATTIIAATPLIASCYYKGNEDEPKLSSISIDLKQNSFSIQEYHTLTSTPMSVECIDDTGNPIETDIEWVILEDDGVTTPSWIKVDDGNRLVITASAEIANYKFNIFAQDKETKTIKSEAKTFDVSIVASPLVPPESIEILNESGKDFMFLRDSRTIHLTVKGHREGFQPEEVSSDCKWTLNSISGIKSRDLMGGYIFSLVFDENGCDIVMSQYIDQTYEGKYQLIISATSILSKYVTNYFRIEITASSGVKYTHAGSGCILTRNNINESWTISSLVSGTTIVAGIPKLIYDYPVTKVGKNLCSVSGITNLTEVALPPSVIEIEESAFANQSNLTKISMPGVQYIGNDAFKNCSELALDSNYEQPILRYVGSKAFYLCTKFSLSTANDLYYIGEFAFCGTAIKTIDIGSHISFIDTDAFTACPELETIIISSEIPPKLGGVLYYGSTNPQSIKVPLSSYSYYLTSSDWTPYVDIIEGF